MAGRSPIGCWDNSTTKRYEIVLVRERLHDALLASGRETIAEPVHGVMMAEETQYSLGATKEGSTTDWKGIKTPF